MAHFADKLRHSDCTLLDAEIGVPDFMHRWEALAVLVAAKLWLHHIGPDDVVTVKCDNLGVVSNLTSLRATDKYVSMILRELALVELSLPYAGQLLNIIEHIPSVTNVVPDALSRLWAPEPSVIPRDLANVDHDIAPARPCSFKQKKNIRHSSSAWAQHHRASASASPPWGIVSQAQGF